MTSITNSSNSNSALIQTIEASDSMVNPSIYNVKEVNPTYASTWVKNQPINGKGRAGSTQNFNLQKYGIIQQILFCYTKEFKWTVSGTPAADDVEAQITVAAGDVFNVIDKIELLSSSRVVSILTSADLLAQFSNLKASEFATIQAACLSERGVPKAAVGVATNDLTQSVDFVVPLHFGFMDDVNLNLNSSFLETLSIRISYGQHIDNRTAKLKATFNKDTTTCELVEKELSDCYLRVLYKSLPEQATAQMLAENFSADSLVQVASRFYDENSIQVDKWTSMPGAEDKRSAAVELKNTDCVESYYAMARAIIPPLTEVPSTALDSQIRVGGYGHPVPFEKIKFTASGQEMLELSQKELLFTRIQENGWAASTGDADSDTIQSYNVAKVQVGLYDYSGGGKLSNTQSLRELNAPRMEFTLDETVEKDIDYRVDLVECTTAIYQIASNTGRLSLALSN